MQPTGPARSLSLAAAAALSLGCASAGRFPLREPVLRDPDLTPVALPCRPDPTPEDPKHVSCAPEEYISPLAWDAADNSIFLPFAKVWAVDPGSEATNVNSLDEVPDSAWFTNRYVRRGIELEALRRGACRKDQMLDGEAAADGAWLIDKGKTNGSSPGFRVKIPGRGKFLFKADSKEQPERPSAASVIGAAVYAAAGFNTSCEQVVYFRRSALKLAPGLTVTDNSGITRKFDEKALEKVLDEASRKGDLIRMQASAWLPGHLIGPFKYEGTRADDPNDRVRHEDRRDLRGGRLVAAWLDHFDAREQNSMDSWISLDKKRDEASPGFVRHYYLDTSDCLGSEWAWDPVSRRLGHSYLLDFGDIGTDFITLGVLTRPWDTAERTKGQEVFGYFHVGDFVPDRWKNEYPNPAFSRQTELDGAWMARVLARFDRPAVRALAEMGQFTAPGRTDYLTDLLEGRLELILDRYLTRLSPIGDVAVEGGARLCGTDFASLRGVRPGVRRHYAGAARVDGGAPRALAASTAPGSRVCVDLPHVAADGGAPDGAASRYVVVRVTDGMAPGPLVAHLYDLGPRRGYRLAGIERPPS
ncbi:MAG TPA: hypothetical protein VHB21_02760 [Minicystis sp.]|nr:hypothetical protein [Minicystis sp.]